MIKTLSGLGLAVALSTLCATANAQASCPDDVEQSLYTLRLNIEAEAEKDVTKILTAAEQATRSCPDRTHAQALAALLMAAVIGTAQDAETFGTYLTLTNQAISQNDASWSLQTSKMVLTKPDGTSYDFYGYNFASRVMEDKVLPGLLRLWQNEITHPLVSGDNMTCPYADNGSARLGDELQFWG